MINLKVLAIVMAGGEGSRLHPLTACRSKPSVPFGGRYRIVDFVLSNLVNSKIYSIYLLVQYKSQSLIEHVRRAWALSPVVSGQFVTVVPPQMREGADWFEGTSDAVYQNLNLVRHHRPDLVVVFGADHIYRMDVRQMIGFHCETGADATVAALPVARHHAHAFGIIATESDSRVKAFLEKPDEPPAMPGDPRRAYASMGNYIFTTDVLVEALQEAHRHGAKDFGRDVLPRLLRTHKVYAYDFAANDVPGVKPYEEPAYWRDVGTLQTYWSAHQDLLGAEPRFDLFNTQWPIHSSSYDGPTAKLLGGTVENSTLGAGTLIQKATLRNCVIRREVFVEEDVTLEDCIIMDYVVIGRGSRLRRAIVDRYNTIPPGTRIGYDREDDRRRYHVDGSELVVVPAGGREMDLVY